ncbi:Hypothetical predicted protein, partial [Paramuricea clavata]
EVEIEVRWLLKYTLNTVVDEGTSLASGNWSTVSRNQFLMLLSLVKLGEEVHSRLQLMILLFTLSWKKAAFLNSR